MSERSLTFARAKQLLETKGLRPRVKVRHTGRKSKNDPDMGRATLLRLDGTNKVVIQPDKHYREETVKLVDVVEWKSQNTVNGAPVEPEEVQQSKPVKKKEEKMCFVVVSKRRKAFYGGKALQWVDNPSNAQTYDQLANAKRAAGQLNSSNDGGDAQGMSRQDACQLIGKLQGQDVNDKLETLGENPSEETPAEEISTEPDTNLKDILKLDTSDMRSSDPSAVIAAMQARDEALQSFEDCREMLFDCFKALKNAEEELATAFASTVKTLPIAPTKKQSKSNRKSPVRDGIVQELRAHVKISRRELVEKVALLDVTTSEDPKKVITNTISNMIKAGLITKNTDSTLSYMNIQVQ